MIEENAAIVIPQEILNRLPQAAKTPWLLYGEDKEVLAQPDYSKRANVSAIQKEDLLRGDRIFEHDGIEVIHPENPFIKENEEGGMHLRIVARDVPVHPKTREEWRKWNEAWTIAFGVAKVSTQGSQTEALWQNFINRTDLSPDDYLVIEFFGRSPKGPNWGKTLPLPEDTSFDHRPERLSAEQMSGFTRILEGYFRTFWIPGLKEVEVFRQRPMALPPDSPSFMEKNRRDPDKPFFWKNELLFQTDRLSVKGVFAGHVRSGVHLMTEFDPSVVPARPWEDVCTALEGLDMTEAAAQLLEETKYESEPLAARTRDTLTGSWFRAFSEVQELKYSIGSEKKRLARSFRGVLPDSRRRLEEMIKNKAIAPKDLQHHYEFNKNAWATKAHVHLYGTRYQDEAMIHFARGIDHGDSEWSNLRPVGMDWMKAVRDVLNSRLIDRLAPASGRIVYL